jgi:hypothetical protein
VEQLLVPLTRGYPQILEKLAKDKHSSLFCPNMTKARVFLLGRFFEVNLIITLSLPVSTIGFSTEVSKGRAVT